MSCFCAAAGGDPAGGLDGDDGLGVWARAVESMRPLAAVAINSFFIMEGLQYG
jgi:hypothetical protein